MKYKDMKAALALVSKCDTLSITENYKEAVISVFSTIVKSLREMGLLTTRMTEVYTILKDSKWDNAYFCIMAKKMRSLVYPAVELCQNCFDD